MTNQQKQAVLDVLNSLEVIDQQGGEESYMIVEFNEGNRAKLHAVGITDEQMLQYGDDYSFCILALAFSEQLADDWEPKKGLILWGPVDDELRYRVIEGEGTAMDAYRLLKQLEPKLFGEAGAGEKEKPEREIRVTLLDGSIAIMNTGDRVLFQAANPNAIPLTIDADSLIDDVMEAAEAAQRIIINHLIQERDNP